MNQVLEHPVKNQAVAGKREDFNVLTVLSALMATTYLTANIMAVKLVSIAGFTLFDAGTITFPLSYMLGDVITELWGFGTAKKVIWLTFACNILLVAATTVGLFLPSPDYMQDVSLAYASIFSVVPRILAASLIAFLAGELTNAWVMERMKRTAGARHLWIRTIGSSAAGYILDTVLFVAVAFAGTAPLRDLITMIVAQYGIKLLIEAVGGTPLAYLVIGFLKKRRQKNDSEQ